ncbi:MAG: 2-aminoethylphosphonate--pyruvate transaminase [Porphyromonadaceae bacterium CG2_30_38_12]|nr:MAG: 2-aminoethylphosphonate--pyruvate transaminase [Porphyromonadaceae bacterium CG2_30_38_12]
MNALQLPENPYLLLTPGPLSTSKTVKATMLRDWCTWDDDYNVNIVQEIRQRLVKMATRKPENYTSVLMQGSGTFSVESVIGSVIPENGKLLVISNGAYGDRMIRISQLLRIDYKTYKLFETQLPDLAKIESILADNKDITHLAVVHCETTTGILNPVKEITHLAKKYHIKTIVDAMSSFGGIQMDIDAWEIDFMISSANKCIQGVPGFGFIIARTSELEACSNYARSHSLDLYDQWATMEKGKGKWRFTSPTHVVRAFMQALLELEEEGGVAAREQRYTQNQQTLVAGMTRLGFQTLLPIAYQSPIITSFVSPADREYNFKLFYDLLKSKGFIIYPGKVAQSDTFRIGSIGEIYPVHISHLLHSIQEIKYWSN